jgi:hypothetical protein
MRKRVFWGIYLVFFNLLVDSGSTVRSRWAFR